MEEVAGHGVFMEKAIRLAEKGRWHVAPNPTVGAVLVRDGRVVAEGWHAHFGEEHAEIICLRNAREKGVDPAGCTLYVTLEPCNHQGKQPPCSKAIVESGIKRVVIGMRDINPQAAGGATFLRRHGIEVTEGVLEEACRDLIADFIVWQTTSRPYVILKMAATLDGFISAGSRRKVPISNEASRLEVMKMRRNIALSGGAVLIGGNTFAMDDPFLTARIEGADKQPLAVVVTSRLPGPDKKCHLVEERPADCVFFSSAAKAASPSAAALRAKGSRVYDVERYADGKHLDLKQCLEILREKENCPYVLCEGGGKVACALLENGLADEFHLHLAPMILGESDAPRLFDGFSSSGSIEDALRLRLVHASAMDGDVHLQYRSRTGE